MSGAVRPAPETLTELTELVQLPAHLIFEMRSVGDALIEDRGDHHSMGRLLVALRAWRTGERLAKGFAR